jgi:putative flippase GtrA
METFLYLFFGGCTTLVNILCYSLFTKIIGINYLISNVIAWIIAVSFAYITNKLFVFNSKTNEVSSILIEILSFFTFRLLTGIMDMGIMWVSIDILHFNDLVMKVISNIIVIIMNYIFSKLFIFKKNKKDHNT